MNLDFYLKNIRENILYVMAKNNFTICDLAYMCRISDRRLTHILSGKQNKIKLGTLDKISIGTGIPVSVLIGGRVKNGLLSGSNI